MRVEPFFWSGAPTIRISPEEGDDWGLLSDLVPPEWAALEFEPLECLARLLSNAPLADPLWRCNASNLLSDCIVYVPQYTGFVQPQGDILERALYGVMGDLIECLKEMGFAVNGEPGVATA